MKICFSVLVPESLNVTILTSVLLPGANYLDIRKGVFLITKNIKSENDSDPEESICFLLSLQKMMKCSEK